MKRKILASVLCLTLLIGFLPKMPILAATELPAYHPLTTPFALFNYYNYGDNSFYTLYAKTGGNSPGGVSPFNAVSEFSPLVPDGTYVRDAGTYTWNDFLANPAFSELACGRQLEIGASATFTDVQHTVKKGLFKSATSVVYPWMILKNGYNTPLTLNGVSIVSAGSSTQRLGDNAYIPLVDSDGAPGPSLTLQTGLGRTFAYDDNLADAKIGSIVVTFADITAPTVSSVSVYDGGNHRITFARPGNTINVRVTFSEPIRFADNTPHALTATISGGGNDPGFSVTANLTELNDNYLNFQCTIPDDGKDHLLNTVDLSSFYTQSSLSLLKNGSPISIGTYKGGGDGTGYTKSPTRITDLAGNPLSASSGMNVPMPAFNIDGVAPHVTKITKTANMHNDGVKTALGKTTMSTVDKDYLDKSDTNAGVGDSITFTADFNEGVAINTYGVYNSNYFWGMVATLNVKDGSGNPVTVRSASMKQVQGGADAPLNGPSNRSHTEVTFDPFTVSSEMVCDDPDGNIRVIGVSPYNSGVTLSDIAGRPYTDDPFTADECTALNTDPFTLDVTPPTVATSIPALSGAYAPHPETPDASYADQFNFPVTITDGSGTNGLYGSFLWRNRTGGSNFDFEYAFTAGDGSPADDSTPWHQGTMGQKYSFTELNGAVTVHIRLVSGARYDISGSSLAVTAEDYAGNTGTQAFNLNYSLDRAAPTAQLHDVARVNSSGSGTLTATVVATDNATRAGDSGTWPTASYVWSDPASAAPDPNDSGWTLLTPDSGSAYTIESSVAFHIAQSVSSGDDFNKKLYVKAADSSGNVSVSDLGVLEYNLAPTQYTAGYTTAITQKAKLALTGIESGRAVAVMVRTSASTTPAGIYYVSVADNNHQGDVFGNTSYPSASSDNNNTYPWAEYSVTTSGSSLSFSFLHDVSSTDATLNSILQGLYYGPLEVTLLSGVNSYADTDGTASAFSYGSATFAANGYTIKPLATAWISGAAYGVHSQTFTLYAAGTESSNQSASQFMNTALTLDSSSSFGKYFSSGDVFGPNDSSLHTLSTPEGLKVIISGLSNALVPEYGLDDVDFSSSYLEIMQTYAAAGNPTGVEYGRVCLSAQDAQTVTIPASSVSGGYTSGRYTLVLHLTAKSTGQSWEMETTDFAVDTTPSSHDFGLAAVYSNTYDYLTGINDTHTDYYGPIYGSEAGDTPLSSADPNVGDTASHALSSYLMGGGTIAVPADVTTLRLYFTAADTTIAGSSPEFGQRAIKAWNATGGVDEASSQAAARWLSIIAPADDSSTRSLDFYYAQIVTDAGSVLGAYSSAAPTLPLIKDTVNVINYQVENANGLLSEVRTVLIYPVSSQGQGTITSDPADGINSDVDKLTFISGGNLIFTPNLPAQDLSVSVLDWDDKKGVGATSALNLTNGSYTYPLSPGLHEYYVYTRDSYGNYKIYDPQFSYVDTGAPVKTSALTRVNFASDSVYQASVSFKEETIEKGLAQTLLLSFDDTYGASLNLSPGDTMSVPLPMNPHDSDTYTAWQADTPNSYGIYRVDVKIESDGGFYDIADLMIYGAVRYDGTNDGQQVNFTLNAALKDAFGNQSVVQSAAMAATVKNPGSISEYPEVSFFRGYLNSDNSGPIFQRITAVFDTPVMLEPSLGTDSPSPYDTHKTAGAELPVFGYGENDPVKFRDIFGTEYTQYLNTDGMYNIGNRYDAGLEAGLSVDGYTAGPETLTITAGSPNASFAVYNVTGSANPATDTGKPLTDGYVASADPGNYVTAAAGLTITADAKLRVNVKDGSGGTYSEYMYVNNIRTGTPSVILSYYYDEFKSDTLPTGVTTTFGNVMVRYTSSEGRTLTPVGGTTASHVFRYGDPTSYTFQYTDEAGNAGSTTVDLSKLGLALTEPQANAPRDTSFDINVYAKAGGVYGTAGDASSCDPDLKSTLGGILQNRGYVQSLYYSITSTDDYTLALSGVSDNRYIKVRGNTIEVTGGPDAFKDGAHAPFTVTLTDSAGNTHSFELDPWAFIDNTPPIAGFTIDRMAFNASSKAYITSMSDKSDAGADTNSAAILSPIKLDKETNSNSYNGDYYCTFKDNGTQSVAFTDAAGNTATVPVSEDKLDMTPPTATVSWSPDYKDSNGLEHPDSPPAAPSVIHSDVVAHVSYDRPIEEFDIYLPTYDKDGNILTDSTGNIVWQDYPLDPADYANYADKFTVVTGVQTAAVVFHRGNFAVLVEAWSLNGKYADTVLQLGSVIDKTPPVVTVSPVSYSTAAGFSVPTSASFTLTPDNDVYCPNIDPANPGTLYAANKNILIDNVTANGVYIYAFTDKAGNTVPVTVNVATAMDRTPPHISVTQASTGNKVDATVSMDEAGTLTVTDKDKNVLKSASVQNTTDSLSVSITQNGVYLVTAVDLAGNSSTSAFVVGAVDTTPPTLWLSPVTVGIRQNSGQSALNALLAAGVNVQDNLSAQDKIKVTNDASGVDLSKTGTYTVTYTATDEAGNSSTAVRFVQVYPENELDVLVNGVRIVNGGTAALSSTTVTFALNNPADTTNGKEPYTVYLRSGIRSEGQMKSGSDIWLPNAGGNYTLPSTGFFTALIVTQSRETYLVTLYVQR